MNPDPTLIEFIRGIASGSFGTLLMVSATSDRQHPWVYGLLGVLTLILGTWHLRRPERFQNGGCTEWYILGRGCALITSTAVLLLALAYPLAAIQLWAAVFAVSLIVGWGPALYRSLRN